MLHTTSFLPRLVAASRQFHHIHARRDEDIYFSRVPCQKKFEDDSQFYSGRYKLPTEVLTRCRRIQSTNILPHFGHVVFVERILYRDWDIFISSFPYSAAALQKRSRKKIACRCGLVLPCSCSWYYHIRVQYTLY